MGANGFTSPPKEGMLQIFITLKNLLPSARIEPANFGSNGKHASHYTTWNDTVGTIKVLCILDLSNSHFILDWIFKKTK
jgi:hypothetical protein